MGAVSLVIKLNKSVKVYGRIYFIFVANPLHLGRILETKNNTALQKEFFTLHNPKH